MPINVQSRFRVRSAICGCLLLFWPALLLAGFQTREIPARGVALTKHATGTFEVKLTPQSEDKEEGATLGRMAIQKQFHGGLEATSRGEMLTAMTDVKGSAGYVAIERVTGTLEGRRGSFVLQHSGTMSGGEQHLEITVVPNSGTGELTGLAGRMTIQIANGIHSYDFEYTLPEAH